MLGKQKILSTLCYAGTKSAKGVFSVWPTSGAAFQPRCFRRNIGFLLPRGNIWLPGGCTLDSAAGRNGIRRYLFPVILLLLEGANLAGITVATKPHLGLRDNRTLSLRASGSGE